MANAPYLTAKITGSTGTPKGVLISHRAASFGINHFSLNGCQRWLLFYNPIFSAAQRTILATLSKGACLCLARKDRLATALPEVLQNLKVDALGITPSALSLLHPSEVPQCLQQITTVGETLSHGLVDQWANHVELRVSYGLSECAQLNFSRLLCLGDNPCNVGKPTDTTTVVILVPGANTETPVGHPGELCLYGPQVANGYHQRFMETRRSFVKNPFGPGILFRSGDLAVKQADGTIEILGRIDFQVKIHGQRVEPQEITTKLATVDGSKAVACFGANIQGRTALVMAVIPKDDVDWIKLVHSLRQKAQASFPRYMVPSYWLRRDQLPVNQNGKADIAYLRQLAEKTPLEQLIGRDLSADHATEVSPEAVKIRDIWAEVLGLAPSSIQESDSFASIGGTSIEAIRIIRKLNGDGIHISLSDMLQSQSLEEVAKTSQPRLSPTTTAADLPPFSLLPYPDVVAELKVDRGIVDAFPPTALQTGILASTIQGVKDYLYQRVYDVRHLDLIRLKLAFQTVFSQSETLRSTFITTPSGFAQVIRHDWTLPWVAESLPLTEYLEKDRDQGVVFGQPFVRACVLNGSILVVSSHHTLFDYWSHGFVFEDIARVYSGSDPVKRMSWKSFICEIQGLNEEVMKNFWAKCLAPATATIINNAPTPQSSSVSTTLNVDIRSATSRFHTTSSAVFYTAWAWVLAQHTRSSVVTMAIALSGRELPVRGIETLDGPTLAVVPQVVRISNDRTLQDLVKSVNNELWEIVRHSQYGVQRALAAACYQNSQLFDTMVNILVHDQDTNDRGTREVFEEYWPRPVWKTEYTTLTIQETETGFRLNLTGLMDTQRLGFILEQFGQAVRHITLNPEDSIRSLELIGAEERAILLQGLQPQLIPRTLHGQFEKTAQEYPSRLAINYQNEVQWTYRELDEKANQLSHYLSGQGIQQGDIIPLLLEKSPLMILAILSLFKLGAAYVPLSPENPPERNAFIVQDVRGKVVLTETGHSEYFASESFQQLLIDTVDLAAHSTASPNIMVAPDQVSYLLYTSGSTGQPKGVIITHQSCAAAMQSIIDFEQKQEGNFRALQFSNYVFDVSLYDFFVTLHSGGTLCIAPTERLLNDLAACINEMTVDHVFLTPTVARLLDPNDVPGLKSMTVGGEQLTRDVVTTWASSVELRNGYGPTEASVLVTMKDVDPSTGGGNIGHPIRSVAAVILDPDGAFLTPYGAVGELCFWGPQLAEGYFKRPETTAQSFITADILNGKRIYRTGDLARFMPGREIECLGRKDDQVKVNGHRIELGEIEQTLLRTGEVKDCVMAVWKQGNVAHLVACVVFESVSDDGILEPDRFSNNAKDLKNKLSGLATYMNPKVLLPFGSIPRLPSGKANRKLLKATVQALSSADLATYAFDQIGVEKSEGITPLQTNTQRLLHQAWVDVLQLLDNQFGLEASFLTMGADSIAAINLVSYLRKKGARVTVGDVLRFPLLGEMAEHVVKGDDNHGESAKVTATFQAPNEVLTAIKTSGLETKYEYIYPCPPGQAEFLTQGDRSERFWCLMTLRELDPAAKIPEWVELVRKLTETNEILRTTFTKNQGKWYGVVLKDTTPVVTINQINDSIDEQRAKDSMWNYKFVFGNPFIRYNILCYPNGTQKVLTKLDHGLYDGTLLRIFDAHFRAYQQDLPVERFTSFMDYSFHIWHSNQQRSLEFWKQPSKRPIPFHFPSTLYQPSVKSQAISSSNVSLDLLAQASRTTVSIIFQSVFQLWLSLRSGRQDVAFDYLYTGRNVDMQDPQSINGTCANFLPLRAQVASESSYHDFLRQTQKDFWEYTENSNVGMEDIYGACGTTREGMTNRALFLFQPFEPVTPSRVKFLKWVTMAQSEITMPEPYAVVFEVAKTVDNGYKLKFAYDTAVWGSEEANQEVEIIKKILDKVSGDGANPTNKELLESL